MTKIAWIFHYESYWAELQVLLCQKTARRYNTNFLQHKSHDPPHFSSISLDCLLKRGNHNFKLTSNPTRNQTQNPAASDQSPGAISNRQEKKKKFLSAGKFSRNCPKKKVWGAILDRASRIDLAEYVYTYMWARRRLALSLSKRARARHLSPFLTALGSFYGSRECRGPGFSLGWLVCLFYFRPVKSARSYVDSPLIWESMCCW